LGYEFGVNESPFTSGQNAAINSGFTSGDKAALDAHLADTIKHITSTERTTWNAKQAALSQEQLEVVNNEPYTAAEQTKLANITEGTPPDNATLEISAGNLRVKPQTTLSSISESTAKFAASTPFAFGDFFNNAVAKINGIISALSNVVPNTRTVNGKALSADITLAKGDVGLGNVANAAAVLQTADIIGMAVAADDAAAKAYSDAHPGVVTFGYED
jgi:hypothetical protein